MNTIEILGRMSSDLNVHNDKFATASVAVHRNMTREGQPDADFIEIVLMNEGLIKFATDYAKKGAGVLVTGTLANNERTAKDGKKYTVPQILVRNLQTVDLHSKSAGVNNVVLTGGLTRDSEKRGDNVAVNAIAINHRGKEKEETDYFNLTFLGTARADFAEKYLKKGTRVLVNGSLQGNQYNNADGEKRTSWQVIVNSTEFMGSKKDASAPSNMEAEAAPDPMPPISDDDDIPLPFPS